MDPSARARRARAEPRDGAGKRQWAASLAASWTRAANSASRVGEVGKSDARPVASGEEVILSDSEKQGQHPTEAGLARAGIPGDPMLPRPFLALPVVERQKTLGPTLRLRRLGSDMKHGAEGSDPRALLPERLAQSQRELGLGGLDVVGESEGVPGPWLGGPGELAN